MEIYFLRSAACLAVLLFFYKLLLEQQNMHVFKRFYLLTSVVAAIIIPLITFTTYIEHSSENINSLLFSAEASSEVPEGKINYWPYILLGIYLLGVFFFSIKFFRNLRNLILKIRRNPKIRQNNFTNVLLSEKTQPHTFFSFIFFNKKKYLHNEIPEDVKIHEEAHARQKHSLDVIFIELLQIIFWINPLIFLLKNAIKLNHEFLADRAVIQQGISTSKYQQTLLSYSSGDLLSDLVNPINYSSIKKRFTVMKTKTSKTAVWVKSLLVLPLLAILVYGFSTKEFVLQESQSSKSSGLISNIIKIDIHKDGKLFLNNELVNLGRLNELLGQIANSLAKREDKQTPIAKIEVESGVEIGYITDVKSLLMEHGIIKIEVSIAGRAALATKEIEVVRDVQEKATPEMIAEYNKLVRHYNSMPEDQRNINQEDINKIMVILHRMSPEQKAAAEKINFDVPPPPPPAPEAEMSENVPPPPSPPAPENGSKYKKVSPKTTKTSSMENKNLYMPAQAPPPPNSNTLEYMKELANRGATFYVGPHKYSFEDIIEMVKKSTNEISLDVSQYPTVNIGGC